MKKDVKAYVIGAGYKFGQRRRIQEPVLTIVIVASDQPHEMIVYIGQIPEQDLRLYPFRHDYRIRFPRVLHFYEEDRLMRIFAADDYIGDAAAFQYREATVRHRDFGFEQLTDVVLKVFFTAEYHFAFLPKSTARTS